MATEIRPVPNEPVENPPASIGTPEGDNEIAPDQPLQPSADIAAEGLEDPRGNEPDPYKQDHD